MSSDSKEPWLALFDEEYFCLEKGTVEHDRSSYKAYQLTTYYWERNNESGPFFRWGNEKETFADFVSFLFDIIVRITPLLSYNDARQDVVVQLILELRNLPPNPVKAWNGDRLVPLGDPILAEQLDETWGATFASDGTPAAAAASSEWKEQCDEWVNFSSFLARCIQARVDDQILPISKYPRINIADGLDVHMQPGIKRDSRVMIAAQYILLAGPALDEGLIQDPKAYATGVVQWQSWARRFKELAEMELASEVKAAVIEARKKLISLRPELFSVSEGGTKPDN